MDTITYSDLCNLERAIDSTARHGRFEWGEDAPTFKTEAELSHFIRLFSQQVVQRKQELRQVVNWKTEGF